MPSICRLSATIMFATLLSCSDHPTSTENTSAKASAAVANYRPPAFSEQNRKQKLRGASSIVDKAFKKFATETHFPGMAYGVVVDDELVLAGADGFVDIKSKTKATTKSLFRIASMSKSFTAMAIIKLRDDGKLQLDDPASKYIPELASVTYLTEDSPVITIRNLLTMTAGFSEDNPWGDRQLADTPDQLIDFIKSGISFSNVPSKEFEYSNMGYAMLGQIISKVSGVPFQRYITENILIPLGMTNTKWEYTEVDASLLALGYRWEDEHWKEEPLLHDGIYGAMGGLITSVEDFSKYVMLHLSAWPPRNGKDEGPIRRSSLREMHKGWQFRGAVIGKDKNGQPCASVGAYGYGLGWRRACDGEERVSHSGGLPGFGSEYRFYPELGFGIICFANLTYASAGQANSTVMDTLLAINALTPRTLPTSDTLAKRKDQIIELLTGWDEGLANKILAENFYLDFAPDRWKSRSEEFLSSVGKTISIEPVVAENQLRGKFLIKGEKQDAEVFFTLTPEHSPKIQQLDLKLIDVKQ